MLDGVSAVHPPSNSTTKFLTVSNSNNELNEVTLQQTCPGDLPYTVYWSTCMLRSVDSDVLELENNERKTMMT